MKTSTKSIWTVEANTPAIGSLASDISCEVCVIGAGIAGLTTAYQLAGEGKNVVVLEGQSRVANGESSNTSAHLSDFIDDGFAHVKAVRGKDAVALAYQSHRVAIEKIERIVRWEKIDCEFRRVDGYLFSGGNKDVVSIADEELVCKEAGIPVERGATIPSIRFSPSDTLRFGNQAQFQPRKYLAGLAQAARKRGAFVFTDTRVESISGDNPVVVTTRSGRKVKADAVVIATNTPICGGVRVNIRIAAYTSYVIAAEIPPDALIPCLMWDTEDPYHYVRTESLNDGTQWLIVGGEDHKTGQKSDQSERWDRLELWMREKFPAAGEVRHRWDGEVFETPDGLGLIGADPGGSKNVFIATGDSGMGLTHGTIAGMMLPDLIAGRDNPWAELYSPTRLPIMAARTLIAENLNAVEQMTDWVTKGDVPAEQSIEPGSGAVIRHGLSKVAVYRGDDGSICEMSATCPHMGGVVRWNNADQTWDCPLHGSRFSADGKVFHGPATQDLKLHEPAEVAVHAAT
jgi:glycine/D-amino acid oxidase-like deaminating enzyme/nitrite reductase/ring-hydroxylating ferredoxin subunit